MAEVGERSAARHAPALPATRSTSKPLLSAIIVNYHQWRQTADLARQLLHNPDGNGSVEVVVIDNHSPPHPLLAQLRREPGVSVRRWKTNHGFARAVNEGCRLSRGDWVLLLNPDITLGEGFIDGILACMERAIVQMPNVGVIGFRLHDCNGRWQRSTGSFPTLLRTLSRMLLPRARRKYGSPRNDRASRVDWVTGCCALVRRQCVEDLEGFDENYFLYYEDVDLCRRATERGWSVWYEPAIHVVHHHPLHAREVPAHLRAFTRHALLVYAFKYWSRWQFRVLRTLVGLEARFRQWRAAAKGRAEEAAVYRELTTVLSVLSDGQAAKARRRLTRLVSRRDPSNKSARRSD
jgi:GT2 family glycosyltransferase